MIDINKEKLLDEVIMLLMSALSISGVKDNKMQEALKVYEDTINIQDDDKDIINIILNLKNTHKELFN